MILSLRSIRIVEGRGLEIAFISSAPKELVDRLNLFHQKKAGNDSKTLNGEIFAIVGKLFQYDCFRKEEHAGFIKRVLFEVEKNYVLFYFRYK